MALAHDGQNLYVGGDINLVAGVEVNRIVRWNGSSFDDMDGGANMWIWDFVVFDAQGNLYAGGGFEEAGGVEAKHVTMWDGQTWPAVGEGTEWPVRALAFAGDGTLYAAEVFEYIDGDVYAYVSRIKRWDGDHWSTLEGEFDGEVNALAMVGDALYVGGGFKSVGGVSSTGIAAWREGPPTYPVYMPLIHR